MREFVRQPQQLEVVVVGKQDTNPAIIIGLGCLRSSAIIASDERNVQLPKRTTTAVNTEPPFIAATISKQCPWRVSFIEANTTEANAARTIAEC